MENDQLDVAEPMSLYPDTVRGAMDSIVRQNEDEAARMKMARKIAAAQLLRQTDYRQLDDAGRTALFRSCASEFAEMRVKEPQEFFNKRAVADMAGNLDLLRRFADGEWQLVEDPDMEEWRAKKAEGEEAAAKFADEKLGGAQEYKEMMGDLPALAGAGMPGAQFGNFMQNAEAPNRDDTIRRHSGYDSLTDEEKAEWRRRRIEAYDRKMAIGSPVATFLKMTGGLDDNAKHLVERAWRTGELTRDDLKDYDETAKRQILGAVDLMRGDQKTGRLFGVKVDLADPDAWLKRDLYAFQQSILGIPGKVKDAAKDAYDWAAAARLSGAEREEAFKRIDEEAAIKAALEQPLAEPESFLGAMGRGVAENIWFLLPVGGQMKGLQMMRAAQGLKPVAEGGKVAGFFSDLGVTLTPWRAGRVAKEAVKQADKAVEAAKGARAAALSRGVKAVGEAKVDFEVSQMAVRKQMAAMQRYTEALRNAEAVRGAAAARVPGQIAKWWGGAAVREASSTAMFSSFFKEYVDAADAAGISREDSVPTGLFVGFVNDMVERLYVPGLEGGNLAASEIKYHMVESAAQAVRKMGGKGLKRWAEKTAGRLLGTTARTVATESGIEEPTQQLMTEFGLALNRRQEQLRKDGQGDVATAIADIWQKATAGGVAQKVFDTYCDAAWESLPGSIGLGILDMPIASLRQRHRNWWNSRDEGLADAIQRGVDAFATMHEYWKRRGDEAADNPNGFLEAITAARKAFRAPQTRDVVKEVADAAGVDVKTAEVMTEYLRIEADMELVSPKFSSWASQNMSLADIDEATIKTVLPGYVEGSFASDPENGIYSGRVRMDDGTEKTIAYRVGDWSEIAGEYVEEQVKDGSNLGKSFDARQAEAGNGTRWADLTPETRRAVAITAANGLSTGKSGIFELTDSKGEKVRVNADDIILLANGRLADIGYGAAATQGTVRHETFHSLWRFVRGTLADEDVQQLAKSLGVDVTADGWENELDEIMGPQMERYASGHYVSHAVSSRFDKMLDSWAGKIINFFGQFGPSDEVTDPKTGKPYQLKGLYDSILRGELGSGTLGVELRKVKSGGVESGGVNSPTPNSPTPNSSRMPVEVTDADRAEAEAELREVKSGGVGSDGVESGGVNSPTPSLTHPPTPNSPVASVPAATAENPADAATPNQVYYRVGLPNSPVKLVGRLEVRDVETGVITSTDEDYHDRGNQNRDDKSEESRALVEKIGANPDPLQIGTVQPIASNGIVWALPNGDVVIGNHRVNGVRIGYEKGTAAALEKFVREDAARRGIEIGADVKKPLMVFVLERIESPDGKADVHEVVRLANESQNRGFNVREQAGNDAKILLDNNILPRMAFRADGRIDETKSGDAIGKFRQESGAQGMVAEDGSLTEEGQTRIQNAALAVLLGGEGNNALLNKIMTNAGRLDMTGELRALMKMTPELMSLADAKPSYDLRAPLAEALQLFTEWRDKDETLRSEKGKTRHDWRERAKDGHRLRGLSWEMFMSQGDMFRQPSEEAKILGDLFARAEELRSFDREDVESAAGKKRVIDLISGYLADYIENARAVNTETEDMFGGTPASRADLLAAQRALDGTDGARFSIAEKLPEVPKGTVRLAELNGYYYAFGKDAEAAAPLLGLSLVTRNGETLTAFPSAYIDTMLAKLIRNGKSAALLDRKADGTFDVRRTVEPGLRYSIAGIYTGSAADYEKPSLHAVGTGEGSQVYGWGLYGSTVRGVAEGYAMSNGGKFGKTRWRKNGEEPKTQAEIIATDWLGPANGNPKKAIKLIKDRLETVKALGLDVKPYLEAIKDLRDHGDAYSVSGTHLYEQTFFTDRAPGDESHLLKWYEPVSEEQLGWIESRLKAEGIGNVNMPFLKGELPNPDNPSGGPANAKIKNGRTVYYHLANKLGSPQAASKFLARAGIDGVKYPVDSYGGKTVKDGDKAGWNYVSFRDDNIRVDHKWTDGQQRFSVSGTYNPRSNVPAMRGGWNEKKILRYLKANPSLHGVWTAARLISEFDTVDELKDHMFYHGTRNYVGKMQPSMTQSERWAQEHGGGGYGQRYWGISVSKSKKVASNFGNPSPGVSIYPVVLAKGAKVIDRPDLTDAANVEDHIVELWNDGVDAVRLGDWKSDHSEQELLVLNPRAICNIGTADSYRYFRLGSAENPLDIKDDAHIARMLEAAKEYAEYSPVKRFGKPVRPSLFLENADGSHGEMKPMEVIEAEKAQYEKDLAAWRESEQGIAAAEYEWSMRDTIRFSVSKELTDAMRKREVMQSIPVEGAVQPWPENFPKVMLQTTLASIKQKWPELHAKAKAGDRVAALELVRNILGEEPADGKRNKKWEKLRSLAAAHPGATVAYVHAEEATGRNKIPMAYAAMIESITDLRVDGRIRQTVRANHTGANAVERMTRRAAFDGPVQSGAEYILVDDHVTQGGTLNELRKYIQSHGGKVVAVTTLTASQFSDTLHISREAIEALYVKFGNNLDEELQEAGIANGVAELTQSQARELRKLRPDTFRERIAGAIRSLSADDQERAGGDSVRAQALPSDARRNRRVAARLYRQLELDAPEVRYSLESGVVSGATDLLPGLKEYFKPDGTTTETGTRWAKAKQFQRPIGRELNALIDRALSAGEMSPEETAALLDELIASAEATDEIKNGVLPNFRKDSSTDDPTVMPVGPDGKKSYTPERAAIHQRIYDVLMADRITGENNEALETRKDGSAKEETVIVRANEGRPELPPIPLQNPSYETAKEFRIDIIVGPPAAGKSSVFANALSVFYRSRVLDCDAVKKMLPGFNDGNGANYVHTESSDLNKQMIRDIQNRAEGDPRRGENVVLPVLGDDVEGLRKKIADWHAAGYTVYLHNNRVPILHAFGRALLRTLATGRWINPKVIKKCQDNPTRAYNLLKKEVDYYDQFSNDVTLGESPIWEDGNYTDPAYGRNIKRVDESGRQHSHDGKGVDGRLERDGVKPVSQDGQYLLPGAERWSTEAPRRQLAYPQLRSMSDDELLSAAVAVRMALGESEKFSDKVVKINTVQKMMRRLHPDWDTSQVGLETNRVLSGARELGKRIREDIDRGVSESLVLRHLPDTVRGQFGAEMRDEARRGQRLGRFGQRVARELEERQRRLVEDAVRVQTGLDAGAIENAFGINLSETIMHLAENPLKERPPEGAGASGEGEGADGQAEIGQEEAPAEIDAKVKAVVEDILRASMEEASRDARNRADRRAAAGRDAENQAAADSDGSDEGSVPADSSAGDGDALAAAVAKAALDLENPRHLARFVAELARRQWIKEHHLAVTADVWRDLVAVQFLRKTAQSVYAKLVRDLTYSRSRETAMQRIAKLDAVPTVAGLVSEMEFIGALINAQRIRDTQRELCEKLDLFLRQKFGAQGRFKPDKEEGKRSVSAEAELRARYMRHAMWLTPDAAAEEARELQETLDALSVDFQDAGRDVDQSREFVETIRKLNVLREFGALRYKPVGEIEAAAKWWEDFARGESDAIVQEMSDRDIRTKKAAHLLAAAFADPKRTTIREGGRADALNRFVTGHMGFISLLQDCMRHASDADAAAVKDIIDYISREIQKSGDRSEAEKRRHNDAFHAAVESIYGKKFNAVMKEMMAPDERFTKYMGVVGGKRVTPTKGRALQLLVSLLQEGRKVQVEDEDNPGQTKTVWEGGYHDNIVKHHREGQAAEIMRLLDPADMNMLKWLGQWYELNRSDLSQVCRSLFGIGVYAELPNYFPVKMLLETQGLEKGQGVGWTIFPKALTPRVRNERDFDTSADIFSMWASRMEEAAQWKHHAQLGLEMRGIFGRAELREAVRANHGASVDDLMQGFITDILAGHGAYDRSTAGVQYFSDQIRGWTALCALGGNIGVMFKQMTSIPAFGFEIGLVNTAKYIVSAFTPEGMSAIGKIWNSEQRRTRWQVGSSEAVRNALNQQNAGWLKRMLQKSMVTTKAGDVVPALVVGQGIYRDCLDRGMSEEDAMAETWSIIERTQQSGRMENQTSIQRRNKLGRIMFQFLSTQQQYLQYEVRAIREVMARPDSVKRWGSLGRAILLNHFILSSAYYWVGQLYKYALGQEPPEDELKDWLITCLLGPYGSLFVAGFCCKYTLERAFKGYSIKGGSSMLPMESWLKTQVNDGAKLLEAIFDSDGDTWDNMLEAAGRWMSDSNSVVRDLRKIYRYRIKGEPQSRK